MSGANCSEGCTNCPTCRGEVQPDSPAMHDMNFAMAMERQALADPVWGPLRVAQTVRNGIRARGGLADGDKEILRFIDGALESGVRLDASPPWLFEASDEPQQPANPAPVVTPSVDPKWRKFLAEQSEYNPGAVPVGGETTHKPECKILEFNLPLAWRTLRPPSFGFYFIANLIFKNQPPDYLCGCCVFRQLIRMTSRSGAKFIHDVNPRLKGPYGAARPDGSTGADMGKDDRTKDAANWGKSGCLIWYEDSPGPVGPFGEGQEVGMKYEFLGLVFDRCNNWILKAAKSMTLSRSATLSGDTWIEHKGSPSCTASDQPPDAGSGPSVPASSDAEMKQLVEDLKASEEDY